MLHSGLSLMFPRTRSWYLGGTFLTLEGRKEGIEPLCSKVAYACLHSGGSTFPDGLLLVSAGTFSTWLSESAARSLLPIPSDDSALGSRSSRSKFFLTWVTLRRYCRPSPSARKLTPFFWTTVKGTCLNGVDNLLSLSCLSNTLSPFWMSFSHTFLLQSAYGFPFPFHSLSRTLISSSQANSWSFGNLVLSFRPNNSSPGLTPVVKCGVLRYIIKKSHTCPIHPSWVGLSSLSGWLSPIATGSGNGCMAVDQW